MEEVLRTENISKSFPGVRAVDQVSLSLNKGEILALMGENGAGKSTLTKMLCGVVKPDAGQIILEGQPCSFTSPHDAIQAGISMVFQELSMVGSLSVAENIFAHRQLVGMVNNIRWRELYQKTREFLETFNLDLNPKTLVKRLSMGQQQILEILKAISTHPKVLILDEPTSSLTEGETHYLFENVRKLQEQGMSCVYISHKMSEIFQITDRVVVMRDGQYVGTKDVSEVTERSLVAMMVGREIGDMYGNASEQSIGEEYFRAENFSSEGLFQSITFGLRKGEILGFAGLVRAGRTEVARAIFGIDQKNSGQLSLDGHPIDIASPSEAIQQGIVYITEDRKGLGLFLDQSIQENLVAPSLQQFTSKIGFLNKSKIVQHANKNVQEYAVATPSTSKKILNLSGGNQQKCLVAMWMGIHPRVIVFDGPTRGVDVGAKAEIYQKLREFASQGAGIIMISSELPELIGMYDRILVMCHGRISGEVNRNDFSEELILSYAAGLQTKNLSLTLWEQIRQEAQPVMQALMEETGQTTHLAVFDESEVVYLEKSEPPKKVQMYSRVDRRAPAIVPELERLS